MCIAEGEQLANPKRVKRFTQEQYFLSTDEMQQRFADVPAALENTLEIAKRCNLELELGKPYLPDFPTPDHIVQAAILRVKLRHLDTIAAQSARLDGGGAEPRDGKDGAEDKRTTPDEEAMGAIAHLKSDDLGRAVGFVVAVFVGDEQEVGGRPDPHPAEADLVNALRFPTP